MPASSMGQVLAKSQQVARDLVALEQVVVDLVVGC